MNTQLFGDFNQMPTKMMGPARELGKLTIGKLEQLTMLQLAFMRELAELNLGQLKAAAEISGPEDLKEYMGKQQEVLKVAAEKMVGNAQAMSAIGKEYAEEAKSITLRDFNIGAASHH